jgi:hypothetical protein
MSRIITSALCAILLVAGLPLLAQTKKEKRAEAGLRAVQGAVTDSSEKVVEGAVVLLKSSKSPEVKSFITRPDGTFEFKGLSVNIDYELRASAGDAMSGPKTLSTFDDRKVAIINLKLDQKKK